MHHLSTSLRDGKVVSHGYFLNYKLNLFNFDSISFTVKFRAKQAKGHSNVSNPSYP